MKNLDLHDDLNFKLIRNYLMVASERYFEKAARYDNPLIVTAANYISDPSQGQRKAVVAQNMTKTDTAP